jgi:hypothetical protein
MNANVYASCLAIHLIGADFGRTFESTQLPYALLLIATTLNKSVTGFCQKLTRSVSF